MLVGQRVQLIEQLGQQLLDSKHGFGRPPRHARRLQARLNVVALGPRPGAMFTTLQRTHEGLECHLAVNHLGHFYLLLLLLPKLRAQVRTWWWW